MDFELGKHMKEEYRRKFHKYGYSPKSLGCPKGRQNLRFDALTKYIKPSARVLDFGCGFGDLYGFLESNDIAIDYFGCDVMEEFLEVGKEKYPNGNFFHNPIGKPLTEKYDYIICSGIFNCLYSKDIEEHKQSIFKTMENLFTCCEKVLSIDFQSPYIDFKAPDAYHQNIDNLIKFSVDNLSRRFSIDHSYMPFEFCIHRNANKLWQYS